MITLPDFGTNRLQSMNTVINARRTPKEEISLWQKAISTIVGGNSNLKESSLSTLKLKGFQPHDFIEQQIAWGSLKHSTDALIDFGFTWSHMLAMKFQPHDFKKLEWRHLQQLKITAKEMMQTCMSIHDLVELKFTPQQLHQLGWTWNHITTIGGNQDNISISPQDINLYFGQKPTKETSRTVSRFKF
jgi:hypothetical protein